MYNKFKTRMERAKVLTKLRNGVFPTEFANKNNSLANLILSCMDRDPNARPSAKELLCHPLFSAPLSPQEMTILRQKKEIEELKLQLLRCTNGDK